MNHVKFCPCDKGSRVGAYWQRRRASEHQKALVGMFDAAGVPARFRDLTLESLEAIGDPDKAEALAAARSMVTDGFVYQRGQPRTSLILTGDYGAGKTGTLTPVLRHWLDKGRSGLWIEYYDFCERVQEGYSKGDAEAVLRAAQTADWILLDDVGDLNRNDRAHGFEETTDKQRILYQLINYRHNHERPMLITTNLKATQMAEQFGVRTYERLFESCAIIKMTGRNLRQGAS